MKKALITGITGQAGKYLAELLLKKKYEVYGLVRRTSTVNTSRIAHLLDDIHLVSGDLTDETSLINAVAKTEPDEVYNLAAQSFVPLSWEQPLLTSEVTGIGVMKLLSAIKLVNPRIKFLQSSSSEMFGLAKSIPQDENTPFHPRSPYGVAKTFAHHTTINYRESFDMFACTAICFNFESVDRGLEFVTKKITHGIHQILKGKTKTLPLGNIEAKRDWNYVGDTVVAMHAILQHSSPDDFVVATGESHSVREFLEISFGHFDMDYKDYVVLDRSLIRPAEVPLLQGDSSKLQKTLGWKPRVDFKTLVKMMIEAET